MANKEQETKKICYYAVKYGHTPGIYKDIQSATNQLKGFSGALMRKFKNHKEATKFLKDKSDNNNPRPKQRLYVVAIGHKPGIYYTPEEANEQTKGYPHSKMKMFKNEKDAYHYLNEYADKEYKEEEENIIEKNLLVQDTTVKAVVANHAFVDGSFNEQTQTYGYGGVLFCNKGVFTFKGCGKDERFVNLGSLSGELLAATEAIKLAVELELEEITILYDCEAIELYSQKKPKGNTMQKHYKKFFDTNKNSLRIYFKKVKAHNGVKGNEIADILAKAASGVKLKKEEKIYLQVVENMSNVIK